MEPSDGWTSCAPGAQMCARAYGRRVYVVDVRVFRACARGEHILGVINIIVGSRCYQPEGPRTGVCDLYLLLDGGSIPDTNHAPHSTRVPILGIAQETVLRATLHVITLDDNTHESDLALTRADLVH